MKLSTTTVALAAAWAPFALAHSCDGYKHGHNLFVRDPDMADHEARLAQRYPGANARVLTGKALEAELARRDLARRQNDHSETATPTSLPAEITSVKVWNTLPSTNQARLTGMCRVRPWQTLSVAKTIPTPSRPPLCQPPTKLASLHRSTVPLRFPRVRIDAAKKWPCTSLTGAVWTSSNRRQRLSRSRHTG